MALAYHLIFGCYGFWLPNDPRGSWSCYVGSRVLHQFGPATKVNTSCSLAKKQHDRKDRFAAKQAMRYPPVELSGIQARSVALGVAKSIEESGYHVYAFCVMPDHVHTVVKIHTHSSRQIITHMKGRATQRLKVDKLSPKSPTIWSRNGWSVFLDKKTDVIRAIEYVNQNPIEAGLPRQRWTFVEPI